MILLKPQIKIIVFILLFHLDLFDAAILVVCCFFTFSLVRVILEVLKRLLCVVVFCCLFTFVLDATATAKRCGDVVTVLS